MNLCSKNHLEVCYEGRTCPVCELTKEHNATIKDLKNAIDDLEDQIDNLQRGD